MLDRALALRGRGPYVVQAAIASLHADEPRDWPQIAALYGELARLTDSPVVELNRAVAVAEAEGPEAGLDIVDRLALDDYRYLHSTRGELLRRLGRTEEARDAYRRALDARPRRRRAAAARAAARGAQRGRLLTRRLKGSGRVVRCSRAIRRDGRSRRGPMSSFRFACVVIAGASVLAACGGGDSTDAASPAAAGSVPAGSIDAAQCAQVVTAMSAAAAAVPAVMSGEAGDLSTSLDQLEAFAARLPRRSAPTSSPCTRRTPRSCLRCRTPATTPAAGRRRRPRSSRR